MVVKPGRGTDPLLRRPFPVFEVLELNGTVSGLSLLSKRIGVTTRLLFDAVEGDVVSCLGPLGRPYTLVDPPTEAWMVAGGVGLAPSPHWPTRWRRAACAPPLLRRAKRPKLFYLDWFETRGVAMQLSTEDGTRGDKGRVTLPLERALKAHGSADVMVYAAALNRCSRPWPTCAAATGAPARCR